MTLQIFTHKYFMQDENMNLVFQIRKLKLREAIKEQISHREKKKGGKRKKQRRMEERIEGRT